MNFNRNIFMKCICANVTEIYMYEIYIYMYIYIYTNVVNLTKIFSVYPRYCVQINKTFKQFFGFLNLCIFINQGNKTSSPAYRKKRLAIRRVAVLETGVSRHHWDPIERRPETPRTSQYHRIEGLKGGP